MEFSLGTPVALTLALSAVILVGLLVHLETGRFIATLVFTVYLVGVANFALLLLRSDPALSEAVGSTDLSRLLGVTPFFLPGAEPLTNDQLYLNILLTVPFGLGLPFVLSVSPRTVVMLGVLFSVGIELAQGIADVTGLALPTWSVDINDVLLNSFGVMVGVGCFFLAHLAYRGVFGDLDAHKMGPWKHFHTTLASGRASVSLNA